MSLFLTAEVILPGVLLWCIIMAKGCWVRIDSRLPAQSNQPLNCQCSPPGCRSTTSTTTFAILSNTPPHPTSRNYLRFSDRSRVPSLSFYSCSIASIDHRIDKSHSLPERGEVAPSPAKALLSREGASSCDTATTRAAAFRILNFNLIKTFNTLYLYSSTLWGFRLRLLVGCYYLSMPTLGFLKKKRTKESPGSKDTAGTSSQPGSPLTPTTSAGWESLVQSQSARSTNTQGTTNTVATDGGDASEDQQMTQGASSQQQMYVPSPMTVGTPVPQEQQSNLPSINNLINPPQHDGAGQSYPTQMATNTGIMAANGGILAAVKQAQQEQQQQQQQQIRTTKGKYTLADFEILRTLGTGSFGRVHLVQSKHNQRFYAVKVLKKNQVVKMKQVEHTNDERRMLQEVKHPFLITLWGTFQDAKNIYMVMDFVEGGELFSLLRKTQVRP